MPGRNGTIPTRLHTQSLLGWPKRIGGRLAALMILLAGLGTAIDVRADEFVAPLSDAVLESLQNINGLIREPVELAQTVPLNPFNPNDPNPQEQPSQQEQPSNLPNLNTCQFARNGSCDEPANCDPGTDSADCRDANGLAIANSCTFANDGLCDEPTNCNLGTDTRDCLDPKGNPIPDSCNFARDGECDEPLNCIFGTDTTDCR